MTRLRFAGAWALALLLMVTTNESTLFLGFVTSFDKANVVDQYGDNGLDSLAGVPAIVANKAVIDGVAPPPAVPEPASLVLLGFGVAGVAGLEAQTPT
jgi:hypothetical protein